MTRDELDEKVGRYIRIAPFKEVGKAHIYDNTLPLSDGELRDARAVVDIVLEEAAKVAEATYAKDAFHFELATTAAAQNIRALKSGDEE
jgi:hypothetical protein